MVTATTVLSGAALDAYLVGLRCALPLALRALPLPTVFRLLERSTVTLSAPTTSDRAHAAIRRSEQMARHLPVADTCLFRSMVRWTALRRAGIDVTFVMGVRGDDPDVGHAWVEVGGQVYGESLEARYVPTFRFPQYGQRT